MCSLYRYIPYRRSHHRVGANVAISAGLPVAEQLRSCPNDHVVANARRAAPPSEVIHCFVPCLEPWATISVSATPDKNLSPRMPLASDAAGLWPRTEALWWLTPASKLSIYTAPTPPPARSGPLGLDMRYRMVYGRSIRGAMERKLREKANWEYGELPCWFLSSRIPTF